MGPIEEPVEAYVETVGELELVGELVPVGELERALVEALGAEHLAFAGNDYGNRLNFLCSSQNQGIIDFLLQKGAHFPVPA